MPRRRRRLVCQASQAVARRQGARAAAAPRGRRPQLRAPRLLTREDRTCTPGPTRRLAPMREGQKPAARPDRATARRPMAECRSMADRRPTAKRRPMAAGPTPDAILAALEKGRPRTARVRKWIGSAQVFLTEARWRPRAVQRSRRTQSGIAARRISEGNARERGGSHVTCVLLPRIAINRPSLQGKPGRRGNHLPGGAPSAPASRRSFPPEPWDSPSKPRGLR